MTARGFITIRIWTILRCKCEPDWGLLDRVDTHETRKKKIPKHMCVFSAIKSHC